MTESKTLDLFAEDSHASPLALPGSEKARMMTATSGQKYSALYKKSGPLGSCVRTLLPQVVEMIGRSIMAAHNETKGT